MSVAALEKKFSSDPMFNAMLRDTFSPTILEAGIRTNVIPSEATVNLNCRILPDTTAGEFVAELDDFGDFVACHSFAEKSAYGVGLDSGAGLWFDDGGEGFAEVVVGNAEDGAIADAFEVDEHTFDFGGIDVNAAGDDHVVGAVAEE